MSDFRGERDKHKKTVCFVKQTASYGNTFTHILSSIVANICVQSIKKSGN